MENFPQAEQFEACDDARPVGLEGRAGEDVQPYRRVARVYDIGSRRRLNSLSASHALLSLRCPGRR